MNDILHITHNDADALGCALLANIVFDPSGKRGIRENTYFCSIGSQDDTIKSILEDPELSAGLSTVIISDISISEESCIALENFRNKDDIPLALYGFDHHATNKLNEKFKWWVISPELDFSLLKHPVNSLSAAGIMLHWALLSYPATIWKYSLNDDNTSNPLCDLIEMISRYDTWAWKELPCVWEEYGVEEDVFSIIQKAIGIETEYKELTQLYDNDTTITKEKFIPEYFKVLYTSLKNKENEVINKVPHKAHVIERNGYVIAMMIGENDYTNACCDYINTNYPAIDISVVAFPSSCSISLRTKKDNIDLSVIAKEHGGGGHKAASGFKATKPEMVAFLAAYLMDSMTLDAWYLNNLEDEV